MTKYTKRDFLSAIRSFVEINEINLTSPKGEMTTESLLSFFDHEIELLEKKNAKPTATQTANVEIKSAIVDFMEVGKKYTISNLIKECPACEGMSHPKVTSLIHALKNEGILVRTEEKRQAYFSLA